MRDFFTACGGDFCGDKQVDNEPSARRAKGVAAAFAAPSTTTSFFRTGAAGGDFTAPSSAEFAGGAGFYLAATSTANALLGATDYDGCFNDDLSAWVTEGKARGAAAVCAAPSTADALL